MEIKPTEPNQQKPEVVQIGQNFQLFKPEIILPTLVGNIEQELGPVVILESDIPPIPISIFLSGVLSRNDPFKPVFSPLNPNENYRLTNDDLDSIKRLEKIKKIWKEKSIVRNAESLFYLALGSRGGSEKKNINLYHVIGDKHIFKEELLGVLEKIRVQLFFPNGSYEAQPKTDYLERDGALHFQFFYPLDTGPLPKTPEGDRIPGEPYLHKGYRLRLPRDIKQLSQIQARFVLAPEEPNRGGEN